MRTTLAIDDDVLREARSIATAEGKSLGAVISALARRALAPVPISRDGDVPVFAVPADAAAITSADVRRALDDE